MTVYKISCKCNNVGLTLKGRPILRVYCHNEEDVRLVWLFQSLQEMKIDLLKYQELFSCSIKDELHDIWNILQENKWIEFNSTNLNLTVEGEYYVPLIQSLISKSRVDQITINKIK